MLPLPQLHPFDTVEIIAPASRSTDEQLFALRSLLESWHLNCMVSPDIFGDDLLCANSDTHRLQSFMTAMNNPEVKATICLRGGYGSMRLIPQLSQLTAPKEPKLFIGMSDITALHLFIGQQWHWPTILSTLSPANVSPESITTLKALLFREIKQIHFTGEAFNVAATEERCIDAPLTGGNLCLVQTSIGTSWQLKGQHKIIFLEETGERGYRVDRMLEHITQANLFADTKAIVFGDFTGGDESNGNNLIEPVLRRFAEQCTIPVIKIKGVGHGHTNFPLVLNSLSQLKLGKQIRLMTFT